MLELQQLDELFPNMGHVNRFMVGCDPEFAFVPQDRESLGTYLHAEHLGFGMGSCFGADMNRRLVELRPVPSRSVLRVVASTLATLRYMTQVCPDTLQMAWRTGAKYKNDGIGGHIHFGRKVPMRAAEIVNLDLLLEFLIRCGVFDKGEAEARMAGTPYGRHGDMRRQAYGYEYRSFPSWLESPRQMFLVLTLAKLVVYGAKTAHGLAVGEQIVAGREHLALSRIKQYLEPFLSRDIDARLLYQNLELFGLPQSNAVSRRDFRAYWGISPAATRQHELTRIANLILPKYIPAAETELAELLDLFMHGSALATDGWQHKIEMPSRIPDGACPALDLSLNFGRSAVAADVMFGLVCSRGAPVYVEFSRRDGYRGEAQVSPAVAKWLGNERLNKLAQEFGSLGADIVVMERRNRNPMLHIQIPRELQKPTQAARLREILLASGLPLVEAAAAEPRKLAAWTKKFADLTATNAPKKAKRNSSKCLAIW